ncbi:MAG TPA: F0F1 ATP synthase subunit epsilon [Anaerolineae bacterium]|nr:F0F1 ATP synthase subunit epsilon [Anaerolineae bacterium]HMR63650.1 F0F1 ATP synthase subunit epsilon [Anaerolineae bacterium]
MADLHLEIVTIEGKVFDDHVNMVVAPGVEGVMGILPRHAPLLTRLNFGELQIRKSGQEDIFFAIGGGVMEVQPNHVIVLADSAEQAEEIDLARAEAARQRAQERLAQAKSGEIDFSQAESSLRRSVARIKVAQRRRKGGGYGTPGAPDRI